MADPEQRDCKVCKFVSVPPDQTGQPEQPSNSKLVSASPDWTSVWRDIKCCKLSCCKSCTYCKRPVTKERHKFGCCKTSVSKYVNNVSWVDQLYSFKHVPNVQTVAQDLPVETRLNQFWETWEALETGPKVLQILKEGYTLPFQTRPNLTRSPTFISCYVNPHRHFYLVEALRQLMTKMQ